MTCPKCGNRRPISMQHLVFYPYLSKRESDRRNYAGTTCQMCGHKWNKYQSLGKTTKAEVEA